MKKTFRIMTLILFLMIPIQIYLVYIDKSNYILLAVNVIFFVISHIGNEVIFKIKAIEPDIKYKKLWDNLWKQYSMGRLTGNFKEGYALDEIMGTMEERYDMKKSIDISQKIFPKE